MGEVTRMGLSMIGRQEGVTWRSSVPRPAETRDTTMALQRKSFSGVPCSCATGVAVGCLAVACALVTPAHCPADCNPGYELHPEYYVFPVGAKPLSVATGDWN